MAVARRLNIELDGVCSEIDRTSKGRHRVLRAFQRSTPVRHDFHTSIEAQAPPSNISRR